MKSRFSLRMAAVVGAVAASATLCGATAASADATPTLVANPSTGLTDNQTVQASAAGFTPGETLLFTECATLNAAVVCDTSNAKTATADDTGAATTAVTVHISFAGADPTGQPVGTVNCLEAGSDCAVGVTANDFTRHAQAPISFS